MTKHDETGMQDPRDRQVVQITEEMVEKCRNAIRACIDGFENETDASVMIIFRTLQEVAECLSSGQTAKFGAYLSRPTYARLSPHAKGRYPLRVLQF
ncbi:MAG: hypothetical protein WDN44_11915 [Sphingomonas sp.]